jgi:hypothetical protein
MTEYFAGKLTPGQTLDCAEANAIDSLTNRETVTL